MSNVTLQEIYSDLDIVRECLQHAGSAPAALMKDKLHSVVQRLLQLDGETSRAGLQRIQRELAQLQPLFDQAYELQSGWFKLVMADPGLEYDRTGSLLRGGN